MGWGGAEKDRTASGVLFAHRSVPCPFTISREIGRGRHHRSEPIGLCLHSHRGLISGSHTKHYSCLDSLVASRHSHSNSDTQSTRDGRGYHRQNCLNDLFLKQFINKSEQILKSK